MHKRFFILITVCFMLILAFDTHADLILEPEPNTFYFRNKDKCLDVSRSYLTKGDNGFVSVKEAPDSEREITKIKNNDVIFVNCIYNSETQPWGYIETHDYSTLFIKSRAWSSSIPGWVPMNQLLPAYDAFSFFDEYVEDFYSYNGNFETFETNEMIVLWEWPGSGKIILGGFTASLVKKYNVLRAYKDKQDREWVYIKLDRYTGGYILDGWVCVSDPANKDIPAFNPQRPVNRQPVAKNTLSFNTDVSYDADDQSVEINIPVETNKQSAEPITSLDSGAEPVTSNIRSFDAVDFEELEAPKPLFTIILVVILVSCTALLIRAFWKPRKANS